MEVPQGNSLCSYLKEVKMSFLFPFFCKIREQEGGTGLIIGSGEEIGKGCKRVTIVQIRCKHECK
jgi:hypothetical protein